MHYVTLSFTHKNTPIEIREKLAFNDEKKFKNFYEKILALKSVNEVLILSTCNRVEILASVKSVDTIADEILAELVDHHRLMPYDLEEKGEVHKDVDAVHHLFKVISSLDSVVLGETQIVGQIKDAFAFSYENGYSGQKIARVMHNAFRCSATVRNTTDISKNPVSVASVAVSKSKEIFGGNLGGYTAVVVGAGEMGELTSKHLAKAGANIILVNRNLEKAHNLAQTIDSVTVTVEPFSELKNLVNHYRLLFSATGADGIIIDEGMVEDVSFQRHWFDIAVPRDIVECSCKDIEVYTVDDLKGIMDENIKQRELSAKTAYQIVSKFTEDFFKWLQTLSVDPMIKEIREMARECSHKEIQKAVKKGYISSDMEKQVEKIVHQAFNTFLHEPTQKLKTIAEQSQADTVVQSIQLFFGLNATQRKAIDTYKCDYQIEKDLKKEEGKQG
jgi:glutamyl-tRNA reductase